MSESKSIPLSALGLSEKHIESIATRYDDLAVMFDNGEYQLPTKIIRGGINEQEINSDYLLKVYKQHEIRPERLFEYAAAVFSIANTVTSSSDQKRLIAEADAQISDNDVDEVFNELTALEEHITENSFFKFLAVNYARKSHDLEKRLKYEETPDIKDVWEINLLNAQGPDIDVGDGEDMLVTVVVEAFILPDEMAEESFSDSPALVSIVGEYEEYDGLEEGALIVATPNAFRDGTFIENISDEGR